MRGNPFQYKVRHRLWIEEVHGSEHWQAERVTVSADEHLGSFHRWPRNNR
jgi:hypothetical protein